MKNGTDRADRDQVVCYVQSSPAARSLYQKCGFREIGSSDVDLSEWGGKGHGWGIYTFWYMIRIQSSSMP